jgi:hypothetical protein
MKVSLASFEWLWEFLPLLAASLIFVKGVHMACSNWVRGCCKCAKKIGKSEESKKVGN